MQLSDLAYIDATGYHLADYPTFRQYFVEKYQAIYGADVYLEDDSQDGQWISVFAQAAYDTAVRDLATYNSFPPTTAQGVGLSRVVKINGIERQAPSYSTASLTIVGTGGTVITNGIASDTLQQKWVLPTTVTIPGGGSITVTATAQEIGDVTADAATITGIFTPTRGWQTVNNVAAATPGAPVESDFNLRIRQAASVAIPSLTVLEGTYGEIANVTGVTKVVVYENDTEITDGNSIPPHSICAVVAGGDTTEIANAIELHKTPGTGTYGDTDTLVYDANGMPIHIKFQRAVTATISVKITLSPDVGWSTDFEALIAASVAEVINALPIGSDVLLTKLYSPAYLNGAPEGRTYDIATIELKKNAGSFVSTNIDIAFDENPVCDPDTDVSFVV